MRVNFATLQERRIEKSFAHLGLVPLRFLCSLQARNGATGWQASANSKVVLSRAKLSEAFLWLFRAATLSVKRQRRAAVLARSGDVVPEGRHRATPVGSRWRSPRWSHPEELRRPRGTSCSSVPWRGCTRRVRTGPRKPSARPRSRKSCPISPSRPSDARFPAKDKTQRIWAERKKQNKKLNTPLFFVLTCKTVTRGAKLKLQHCRGCTVWACF